tara:strand:- start:4509 stop:5114 length:606 start_codon:yes stop_codon:yes gene_type:complete
MILDPKWLDTLKLPLRAAAAGALAASVLWWLQWAGYFDLGPLGPIASPVLIIAAVVLWMITLVAVIDYFTKPLREKQKLALLSARREQRRKEQEKEAEVERQAVLAHLDHLSAHEVRVVAEALQEGSPTFYTYVHSPPVTMLQGKGLVWTPGAPGHRDHYPFTFRAFVWDVLLARRDEFLGKHAANEKAEDDRKEAERRGR